MWSKYYSCFFSLLKRKANISASTVISPNQFISISAICLSPICLTASIAASNCDTLPRTVRHRAPLIVSYVSLSKKGSVYLRYALFQVSRVIWQCNSTFRDYYSNKQAEGKLHYVILGHIQKKLVRVIFSVLKNNSSFQERTVWFFFIRFFGYFAVVFSSCFHFFIIFLSFLLFSIDFLIVGSFLQCPFFWV